MTHPCIWDSFFVSINNILDWMIKSLFNVQETRIKTPYKTFIDCLILTNCSGLSYGPTLGNRVQFTFKFSFLCSCCFGDFFLHTVLSNTNIFVSISTDLVDPRRGLWKVQIFPLIVDIRVMAIWRTWASSSGTI